jgi:hypothetical protein
MVLSYSTGTALAFLLFTSEAVVEYVTAGAVFILKYFHHTPV